MKIKVLAKSNNLPKTFKVGDWIDLSLAETVTFHAPYLKTITKEYKKDDEVKKKSIKTIIYDFQLLPLGVAMKLPKGYEAIVAPRSSTFVKYGIIEANSIGVIDNSYCGNNDIWKFPALAFRNATIEAGTRICQFRIQLSQKATIWQKIKWLFNKNITIEQVNTLSETNRGGFGNGTKDE